MTQKTRAELLDNLTRHAALLTDAQIYTLLPVVWALRWVPYSVGCFLVKAWGRAWTWNRR